MNALHEYIKDRSRAEALAVACNTKVIYLRHVALGHRQASVKLARLIEQHSAGKVTAADLRPDVWGEIPTGIAETPEARAA
jgi:DNA-binding transcriptional regulator YdaS (Cro superfamily)